jgi:hypothetical protein
MTWDKLSLLSGYGSASHDNDGGGMVKWRKKGKEEWMKDEKLKKEAGRMFVYMPWNQYTQPCQARSGTYSQMYIQSNICMESPTLQCTLTKKLLSQSMSRDGPSVESC